MQTRISVRTAVLGMLFAGAGAAQPQTGHRLSPSASQFKTAADAARGLRQLYFEADYFTGAAIGDTLTRRFPKDSKVRAWYVANLGGARLNSIADSITTKTDTLSRDPWALAARAFARSNSPAPSKIAGAEATRLARRARMLAPRDPDFAWLITRSLYASGPYLGDQNAVIAFVDSVGPRVGNPVEMQALRAEALYSAAYPVGLPTTTASQGPDSAKLNAAMRAFDAARTTDSMNYQVAYDLAARLVRTDEAAGLRYAKLAVTLSPRAPYARTLYWSQLNTQKDRTSAQRQAAVEADRAEFLTLTDSAPWALAMVVQSMRSPTKRDPAAAALEDRILAKAPHSAQAEDIMLSRVNQWRDSLFAARDSARPGPKSDSNVVRRRYLDSSWAFIEKSWVANPATRDQAVTSLFFEIREDTAYPADKLGTVVRQMIAGTSGGAPSFRYGEGARALAKRNVDLAYAAQLAREGLKHTATYLDDFPGFRFTSLGDKADVLDGHNASLYDDLGVVYFTQGSYADADRELSHALELTKKNHLIYYDLGKLRAAQGKDEEAELLYAQGMTVRVRGVNPNRQELQRLYEKRNGSIDGWESYISSLEEKERATRKAKILGARITDAKNAPSFRLADLNGKVVSSDDVRSRYLVVNFWGTWCGPCVAEMPELQQFYDKYRGDSSITILTISNDKDLAELRDWMSKRKLSIPTLFDDGYVGKTAQIHVFPTTWFIDRDGKVQFSAIGNTGALLEEFTWRLDALRAGVPIRP
jgi:thiol-disulfide isomerase/thioredoxin/tetratricopeptide (TPR) repeat protein